MDVKDSMTPEERIRTAAVSLGERVVFNDMAEPPRFVDMCIHLARIPTDGQLVLRVDKPGRPGVRLDFVGAAGPGLRQGARPVRGWGMRPGRPRA